MSEESEIKKGNLIKDIIMGISLIIIGIGCFFTYNPSDAALEIGSDGMTFATYPIGVASLLLLLSIIYLFNSIRKYIQLDKYNDKKISFFENIIENKSLYFKRVGSVILLVIYAYTLDRINFLVSTGFFLFAAFYLYDRRDYFKMILISVIGSACLYMLFVYFLKLQL
ncbi:tripartite tricarboxylate transporter TctB family protein [Alphaproteobacteria bacterium]|nr:tripartite tricarboxylate transporter TctB family protein [Alphaproteobacteria bacterium]